MFDRIKQTVTMADILDYYGLKPSRSGHIVCPFHPDTDPSLKVYSDQNRWHCFGCGRGGSVIDFVMHMEGVSVTEAAGLIKGWFNITAPSRSDLEDRGWRIRKRKRERIRRRNDEARLLDMIKTINRYNKILSSATEWTPELEEACVNIAQVEYRADCLEEKLYG
jgi:DNA primase